MQERGDKKPHVAMDDARKAWSALPIAEKDHFERKAETRNSDLEKKKLGGPGCRPWSTRNSSSNEQDSGSRPEHSTRPVGQRIASQLEPGEMVGQRIAPQSIDIATYKLHSFCILLYRQGFSGGRRGTSQPRVSSDLRRHCVGPTAGRAPHLLHSLLHR